MDPEKEILGRCGYRCDICPAYSGNPHPPVDPDGLARGWKTYFGIDAAPENTACDGCRNEGRRPDTDCPVRPCAMGRGHDTCAACPEFGCGRLKSRMEFVESVLSDRGSPGSPDYGLFFLPYLSRERLEKLRGRD